MIHFIRPNALLLLIPASIYLLWVIYSYRQHNPWKNVCDSHLLPALIETASHSSRVFFLLTLFLYYLISIFALAGPAWKKTAVPIYHDVSSIMLVLDLSPNMNGIDLKPNRLLRAKYKLHDLINAAQSTQMGLVVFTEEAFTVSPLSQDANTLTALIDELSPEMMPVAGADSGSGLMEGYRLLKQTSNAHGHLLLVTASNPTANSWLAAKAIAKNGGHLHVLAMLDINTNNQAILANLQQLAKMGNGSFYLFTPDTRDIQSILNRTDKKQVMKNTKMENAYLWQDAGPWLCLLLLPLAFVVLYESLRYEKH